MSRYQIPSNVKRSKTTKPLSLSVPAGAEIIVDHPVYEIWLSAAGKNIAEIIEITNFLRPDESIAALACLAEAGLLKREVSPADTRPSPRDTTSLVSVIIVSYNSQVWLADCIASLRSQSHQNHEIIIVDNASSDNTISWVAENHADIRIVKLDQTQSFAFSLNAGVKAASGEYYLILNPDVVLEPAALSEMVSAIKSDANAAAAACKLLLQAAPAFINGIGNYVGPISWGSDLALGHLDLGQFDKVNLVPSACFAAALISSAAYREIGPFDEKFPLYYEDSEWCYRARLFGYSIPAAAGAVGFHAMGSSRPSAPKQSLSSKKLEQVVYGRLRFALKLLSPAYLIYFLCFYLAEDCARMLANLFAGRWDYAKGIFSAWLGFLRRIDSIVVERKRIQSRRVITDKELFQLHKRIPAVLIRDGRAQLTMDIIRNKYLPKMASGKTRQLPEYEFFSKYPPQFPGSPGFADAVSRSRSIVSNEGFSALVHRFGRLLQCRLMRM